MTKRAIASACLLLPLLIGSCSSVRQDGPPPPVLTFHGAGEATERGVVSVTKGVDRGSVEWHLVADAAGEESVTRQLEQQFGMKRLHDTQEFETILRTRFQGVAGKYSARALWERHHSATFSHLECDNATIVFFDANDRAVAAWPRPENLLTGQP